MAAVAQNVAPDRSYSPFEGMSEAQRLVTAVPRGLVRFDVETTLSAKPVNDSIDLQFTCSLPGGFAYIISSLNFEIEVDTATDWDANCQARVFNGLGNGAPTNFQFGVFNMANNPGSVAEDPRRVLNFQLGTLREWWPNPIVRSPGASGASFLINYHNSAAAVQAAGALSFHMAIYQYELNQALRFPLNSPVPVGIR